MKQERHALATQHKLRLATEIYDYYSGPLGL